MKSLRGFSTLTSQFARWRAAFDESVGGLPFIGRWIAPPWLIVEISPQHLQGSEFQVRKAGSRPIVARLCAQLGIQTEIELPAGAISDIASAAGIALETASPIHPDTAMIAVETTPTMRDGRHITVVAHLAHRDVVTAVSALAKRHVGRVDAVDVAGVHAPASHPAIDLLTGRAAVRGFVSPSTLAVCLSAIGLAAGAGGFTAASLSSTAPSVTPAPRVTSLPGTQQLLSLRRDNARVLDAVDALSSALPRSAYLESLEIEGNAVTLTGRSNNISELQGALEADDLLANVVFAGPTREVDGLQSFKLALTIVAHGATQ